MGISGLGQVGPGVRVALDEINQSVIIIFGVAKRSIFVDNRGT